MNPVSDAWSPALFTELADIWKQRLEHHLQAVSNRQTPVLNWDSPERNEDLATRIMHQHSTADSLPERFDQLVGQILNSGQNLHHPRYIGHQVPAGNPIAALFDAVGAVTNQVMAIYEMGPWATAVERTILNALTTKVGWQPDTAGGLLTNGGSLANLTALLTARNIALPDSWEQGVPPGAVLVTHADCHYSVSRSAGLLGLGTQQVRRAALTPDRHMDADRLDQQLTELQQQGRPIIAVSAAACATPTGAFDPLEDVADVCSRHDVWLHVDAAHGGGALMSRQHRHKLAGIDRADSIVWDAHKMLFMPALCAAVLYRNREHRYETFRQDAPYLFDPSHPGMAEYDSGISTVECTKRALGFGLWGVWSLFGEELFEQLIDQTFARTQDLWQRLEKASDFETLHQPECNIIAFRHLPAAIAAAPIDVQDQFQRQLRTQMIQSGEFYIVQTTLDGQAALRACVMNPLTSTDDLDQLLISLRRLGTKVMEELMG